MEKRIPKIQTFSFFQVRNPCVIEGATIYETRMAHLKLLAPEMTVQLFCSLKVAYNS